MPENIQSSPANSGLGASLSAGKVLPMFGKIGRPSMFSREDMNRIVTAVNAFIRMQVEVLSSTSTDGTIQPNSGSLQLSDDGSKLVLYLGAAGSGASQTTPMTIVTEHDNYLTCTPPTGSNVSVCKPYELRRDIYDGETLTLIDGAHTYSYSSVNTRTNTVSSIVNNEVIWWPYVVGHVIYAEQPVGGISTFDDSGNPITLTWLDSNVSAREWGTEITVCQIISGTPTNKTQIIKGSLPF